MTEKHTPGPWHVAHGGYANAPHVVYGGNNGPSFSRRNPLSGVNWIAEVRTDESPDQPTYGANARLIAAAPDLLAALCDLLPLADCYARDRKSHGERIDAARAAIAKATGEQQS